MKCRLSDRAGFWWSAPLLVASIAWEGVVHTAWMLLAWPCVRSGERARVVRLLRQRALSLRPLSLLLVGMGLTFASGCQMASSVETSFNNRPFDTGTSFSFQMRALGWTFDQLIMSQSSGDSGRELSEDITSVFWDPYALASMQEDLSSLFDPEPGKLGETFSLLGW
jgi:hypothetical protein